MEEIEIVTENGRREEFPHMDFFVYIIGLWERKEHVNSNIEVTQGYEDWAGRQQK